MTNEDMELVREYAARRSERAFETLVSRHIGLVHSAALRQVRDPHLAEEITQTVFIILARKAGSLSPKTVLPGWLYRTTRYVSAAGLKIQRRRQNREQEAHMQAMIEGSQPDADWERLSPLLDEAMAQLRDQDRDAIVLRYFQNKSLREVGAGLGVDEYAAQKRVGRALEKLRVIFVKRGAVSTSAVIAGMISAHSVQAAPALLARTVTAVAVAKGAAAGGSTLTLIQGALKLMAWSNAKTAVAVGVGLLLAAGTTTVAVHEITRPRLSATNLSWADNPYYWTIDSRVLDKVPPVYILRPTKFANTGGGMEYGGGFLGERNNRIMYRNIYAAWMLSSVYGFNDVRIILPPGMPDEHFDFMFTLPEDYHATLKSELKNRFGLTAHVESRMMDVLLLQVKVPGARGLKKTSGRNSSWFGRPYGAKITNTPVSSLAGVAERYFGKPVLDKTRLRGKYDLDLDWKPRSGQLEKDAFEQALLDQLGLEFVPSRETIKVLVVDKSP